MGAQQSSGSTGTGRPDSGIGLDFRGASSPTLKRSFPPPPIGYTPSGDAVLERLSRGPDGRFRLRSEDSSQKFTVQCVPVQNPLRFLGDMDSPRSTYDFSNSIERLPPTTNSPFVPSVCTDSEDSDDAESRNEVTETQQFGFPRTPECTTKGVGTTLGKLAPLERRGVDDEERNSDGTGFMAFLEELVGHAETLDDASSVGSAATTYGFDTGTDSGRRPSEDSFGRRTFEISRNTTQEKDFFEIPPVTDDVPRMCDSSSQTESSSGQSGMANRRDTAHSSSSNSSYSGFGVDDASPRGARMSFEADDTSADGSCDDSDSDDGYIEMNVRSRPTSQLQPDPNGSALPAPQGSPKSIRQWPAAVGREGVRLTVMEERVDKMHRQVQSSQDRLAAWLKTKDAGASKKAQLDANSNPASNPNPAIPPPPAAAAGNRRPTGTRRRLPTKPTCMGRTLPTPPNTKLVMPHRPGPSMFEKRLLLQAALSTH